MKNYPSFYQCIYNINLYYNDMLWKMLIYRTPVIKTEEVKKILKHLANLSWEWVFVDIIRKNTLIN